jgi:hypothetical protein
MTHNPRELVLLSVLAFVWATASRVESQIPASPPTMQLARRQAPLRTAACPCRGSAALAGRVLLAEPRKTSGAVPPASPAITTPAHNAQHIAGGMAR